MKSTAAVAKTLLPHACELIRSVLVTVAMACLAAESGRPASATEPRRLSVAQDQSGVTVEADGKPFAAYVIDQANKPYLWP
ncbi:MAG: hypothetical protein ACKOK8_05875, partial [Planctomycetia bacterium]